MSDKQYVKADSIVALRGKDGEHGHVIKRFVKLLKQLPNLNVDAYRREIVAKACKDVVDSPSDAKFRLRPHILSELLHVSDEDLPRYLFYRYRYEVYPISHKVDAFPPCVQIEPTSICNFRCVFCYQTDLKFTQGRHGHMGIMTVDMFKQVVDQIVGEVEAVTLASRGEPFMAPKIRQMLAYAAGKFLGLKVNTNASMITEENAHALLSAEPNTIVFSVDAADPDLYSKLRVNGNFEQVRRNIEQFTDIRRKHYSKSKTIVRISGVRYSPQQDFSANHAFWHDFADQVAMTDYIPWENAYETPANGELSPCSDLWRRLFVWWNGAINPCDVDYKSSLSVGQIPTSSVHEAWTSDAYKNLRTQHQSNQRQNLTPCRSCALI